MIDHVNDLRPESRWADTVWSQATEESLIDRETRARLCVATLLPFDGGKPDWEGFEKSALWMAECAHHYGVELVYVLNADTGYIFNLSLNLYREVIERFRAILPDRRAICGATAVNPSPDRFEASSYLPQLDIAQEFENVEVMIMTSPRLNELENEARRDAYFSIAEEIRVPAIVHALEPSFVPWATPFDPWLLWQLASHDTFVGGKISTLDEPHFLFWAAMCRDQKLKFLPHSGDDFGIASAVKMGLPLLIGAGVSACPLICAAKKMWLAASYDARVYKLFEAFQSLEDAVFRLDAKGSAAAYKHSTAVILQLLGLIRSPEIHPDCRDLRPGDEAERMREALIRPLRMAQKLGIPHFELR